MKKFSLPLLLSVAAFVAIGCSSAADPIVGTWTSTVDVGGMTGTGESTYGADKSFSSTMSMNSPMGSMTMNQKGTWAYAEDKKLKVTLTDATMSVAGASAENKKMLESQFNDPKAKEQLLKQNNETAPVAIKWNGNDEFSTSMQGMNIVFKRKK